MTIDHLLEFVAPKTRNDERVQAVFKEMYPILLNFWKAYLMRLEDRDHLKMMEALLCVATAMHTIQLMQELLDPSMTVPDLPDEFPLYTLN